MAGEKEPAKLLLPYLQRADELQKHEPLVAYYCRLYAMERGLKIPNSDRTKTTNTLLISLMNQLEKDKKSLTLGPDDHLHVEGFALSVFAKADKQDRAGRADLNTAKTFYAASIFFEILTQFGVLQPDLEQKQKYAVWKAADIRKALKEGRKPVPGPPGGDNDSFLLPSTSSGEYGVELVGNGPSEASEPEPDPYPDNDFRNSVDSPVPSNVVQPPSLGLPSPPRYPLENYTAENIRQPTSTNGSPHSIYHHSYYPQPQQYRPEAQQPFSQHHLSSPDVQPYSYPSFQSYPSFSDSTLPTAPTHYPSYYQGSDASYTISSPSNAAAAAAYPSTSPINSGSRDSIVYEASPTVTQKYEYDSSYQPPPEKIAEAHKAARFAVGALAFDDVSVGVDFLKKSLELLTNPSAGN